MEVLCSHLCHENGLCAENTVKTCRIRCDLYLSNGPDYERGMCHETFGGKGNRFALWLSASRIDVQGSEHKTKMNLTRK